MQDIDNSKDLQLHYLKYQTGVMTLGSGSLDCKEQLNLKEALKPLLSSRDCWIFSKAPFSLQVMCETPSFCSISPPMCLWCISAHFIYQTCFYDLQLCWANTSLQEQAGYDSASHIPDITVSFISIQNLDNS